VLFHNPQEFTLFDASEITQIFQQIFLVPVGAKRGFQIPDAVSLRVCHFKKRQDTLNSKSAFQILKITDCSLSIIDLFPNAMK